MSVVMLEKTLPKVKNFQSSTGLLLQKLYQTEGKAEIINGEIVKMPPTGYEPHNTSLNLAFSLKKYAKKTKYGIGVGDNVGYIVNMQHRKSFSPDASFHVGEKTGMKFLEGSPIFAVEVRSENDYGENAEKSIKRKRCDYFAAGTEIVWNVDLLSENVIKSYHCDNPDSPKIFKRGEIANAEPALPKWKIAVDDLFE